MQLDSPVIGKKNHDIRLLCLTVGTKIIPSGFFTIFLPRNTIDDVGSKRPDEDVDIYQKVQHTLRSDLFQLFFRTRYVRITMLQAMSCCLLPYGDIHMVVVTSPPEPQSNDNVAIKAPTGVSLPFYIGIHFTLKGVSLAHA